MLIKSRKLRVPILCSAIMAMGCLLLLFSGCGIPKVESVNKKSFESREQALLNTGYEAFGQADYAKAAEIFNTIYQTGSSSNSRRQALYGLACTRLSAAETENQLDEALALWNTWADSAPDKFSPEDPRLMRPFIQQAESCQTEKEIQVLLQTIAEIKKENEQLRHQIETLEAIEQTIEKKKKEISSP